MSNLRDLNQQNPFGNLFAALAANGPNFAAPNPEARDRGAPPESPAQPDNNTPTSSDDEGNHPPPPPHDGPHHGGHHGGHHGHHPGHGPHPGRGRQGSWGRGGWRGGPRTPYTQPPWVGATGPGGFDIGRLVEFIQGFNPRGRAPPWAQGDSNIGTATGASSDSTTGGKDFAPDADIFDTEFAFVVHISLPGAKKEDVGVNWNADESELSVAGVIYRPGSEEFLKTLAVDERKVGVFERKIKLGSRDKPAYVKEDGIGAKMEDGVLIVTIPKVEKEKTGPRKVAIE